MRIGFFIGALLLGLGACADAGQRADNLAAAQAASAHIQVRRTANAQHATALSWLTRLPFIKPLLQTSQYLPIFYTSLSEIALRHAAGPRESLL